MNPRLAYSPRMRPRLREPAALAAAALALHQLRYLAGHGEETAAAVERGGHAYLAVAGPLIALLVALALAELGFAWRRRQPPAAPMSLARRWVTAGLALVVIYTVQESLEGLLVAGRPADLAALLGSGGWLVGPLAIAFGWTVALILRGADALLVRRARSPRRLPLPTDASPSPSRRIVLIGAPMSRHLAGRAPPPTSSRAY